VGDTGHHGGFGGQNGGDTRFGDEHELTESTIRPRQLTANELGILKRILEAGDFVGAPVLLAQLTTIRVVGGISTFLDLAVDGAPAPAGRPDGPVPVKALVYGKSRELMGEILVWVTDGYLSSLEFAWFSTDMPSEFPRPEQLDIAGAENHRRR
jgi:hypothetical protein